MTRYRIFFKSGKKSVISFPWNVLLDYIKAYAISDKLHYIDHIEKVPKFMNPEPWNDFKPDLTRVGVEAAARKLYEVDFNEYGEATPDFEEYKQEWEEDALSILRAYQKANQGEPNGI